MFPVRCVGCGKKSPWTAEELRDAGWRSFNVQEVTIGPRQPFGPVYQLTLCPACVLEMTLFGGHRRP